MSPRKRKTKEYPLIEIKNEKFVELIYQSDKSLDTLAKESNITLEEIQSLIDEYHLSIELKMQQDKQKRNDIRQLFQDIEPELKSLQNNMLEIPLGTLPKKSYCQVNIGGKWIDEDPKPMGRFSIIKQLDNKEGSKFGRSQY